MTVRSLMLGTLVAAGLGCGTGGAEPSAEQDIEALRANTRTFEEAIRTKDVDLLVSLYLDTYIDWNQAEPVVDQAALRAQWEQLFALDPTITIEPEEILVSGDLGIVRGRFEFLVAGQPARRFRYIEVWQRQPDGSWKARIGMDAPDASP